MLYAARTFLLPQGRRQTVRLLFAVAKVGLFFKADCIVGVKYAKNGQKGCKNRCFFPILQPEIENNVSHR